MESNALLEKYRLASGAHILVSEGQVSATPLATLGEVLGLFIARAIFTRFPSAVLGPVGSGFRTTHGDLVSGLGHCICSARKSQWHHFWINPLREVYGFGVCVCVCCLC